MSRRIPTRRTEPPQKGTILGPDGIPVANMPYCALVDDPPNAPKDTKPVVASGSDASTIPSVEAIARREVRRDCGHCTACDRSQLCGWRQGMLQEMHRPSEWGMIVSARVLPTGKAVHVFQEVYENVSRALSVRQVLSAFAYYVPIIVADTKGNVISVIGPGPAADEVVRSFGNVPELYERPGEPPEEVVIPTAPPEIPL